MNWTGLVWAVAAFGMAVLLIAMGTLAGRPLAGSCGGACVCAKGEEACQRDGGCAPHQHLDPTLGMENHHG